LEILKGAFCTFFHWLKWISRISIFGQKHFLFFSDEKKQAKIYLFSANGNLRFTVLHLISPINQFFYSAGIKKYSFAEI